MLLSLPFKATVITCWEVSFLRPANKVSGKGYVFTPVCQSFCSQEGCLPLGAWGCLPLGQGVYTPLDKYPWHTSPGHTSWTCTHLDTYPSNTYTPSLCTPPCTDGHWSRRYASYWNAFLFIIKSKLFLIRFEFIFIDFKRIINTNHLSKVINANWNLNPFYYGLKLTQGKSTRMALK